MMVDLCGSRPRLSPADLEQLAAYHRERPIPFRNEVTGERGWVRNVRVEGRRLVGDVVYATPLENSPDGVFIDPVALPEPIIVKAGD